uniref:DUF1330 domain-containing protein n=1 Tax=Macrostomum lignano TaxID=282301 RepID=A0A1I8FHB2_9PLAT
MSCEESSLHRNFCNACVRQASVMKQYTGNLLGHCASGSRMRQMDTSDPVFRAQDFLEQVEMYCVCRCATRSLPTILSCPSSTWMFARGCAGRANTLGSHAECVRAAGGFPCVAATGRVHKVRGLRSPGYYMIDAWRSSEQFHAWYTSEAGAAEREKRQQVANADIILACLTARSDWLRKARRERGRDFFKLSTG